MQVKDIMTSEVLTVHIKQKLSEVSALFKEQNIHHIPVVNGRKPVGIITATDLYKLIFDIDNTDQRMVDAMLDNHFSIEEVMNQDLVTLPQSAELQEATSILSDGSLHSVLIVDDNEELAGLVTSTDLIMYLHNQL